MFLGLNDKALSSCDKTAAMAAPTLTSLERSSSSEDTDWFNISFFFFFYRPQGFSLKNGQMDFRDEILVK